MMPNAPSTLSESEIAQIEQHKYFLSEKAGYDVGWEHAEQDWREHFGPTAATAESATAESAPATVPTALAPRRFSFPGSTWERGLDAGDAVRDS